MFDRPDEKCGDNTPEHVAFQLFELIAKAENKQLGDCDDDGRRPTRDYILNAYARALITVRCPETRFRLETDPVPPNGR